MIKYFIQIDTSSYYQSDLIEISRETFELELNNCNLVVDDNIDKYFKKKNIDEFENRIQTEYIFGFDYLDIYLIMIEYK